MRCGATISPDGHLVCTEKHGHDGWHKNGYVKWNFDARAEMGKMKCQSEPTPRDHEKH